MLCIEYDNGSTFIHKLYCNAFHKQSLMLLMYSLKECIKNYKALNNFTILTLKQDQVINHEIKICFAQVVQVCTGCHFN